jgi:hypothetical protein
VFGLAGLEQDLYAVDAGREITVVATGGADLSPNNYNQKNVLKLNAAADPMTFWPTLTMGEGRLEAPRCGGGSGGVLYSPLRKSARDLSHFCDAGREFGVLGAT